MNQQLKIILPSLGALLFLFCGSFNHDLWRPAEAREAAIAKEMLESGNFVATYLNGKLFLEKPPLYTWAMAASFKVLGYKPCAARIPAFLFGIITLLSVFLISSIYYSKEASAWSALMLSSMWLFQEIAHIAMLDNGLLAFVSLSMFFLIKIIKEEKAKKSLIYGFHIAAALAFLTKGAIGVILIGAAVFVYVVLSRNWQLLLRLLYLPALLVFCIIVGSWLLALWVKGGKDYFYVFFIENHLNRALGKAGPGTKEFFYYFPYLPIIGLPWVILLPAVLWSLKTERDYLRPNFRRTFLHFLIAWFAGMFIALNIAGSKDNQYLAPLLPPIAIMCAYWVETTTRKEILLPKWAKILTLFLPSFLAVGLVGLPFVLNLGLKQSFSWTLCLAFSLAALLIGWICVNEFKSFPASHLWQKFALLLCLAALTLSFFIEPILNKKKSSNYLIELLKKYEVQKGMLYGYNLGENIDGLLFFYDIPPITIKQGDYSFLQVLATDDTRRFILVKYEKKDFIDSFIEKITNSQWKLLTKINPNARPLYLFSNRLD